MIRKINRWICDMFHRTELTDESGIYSWHWCAKCGVYRMKVYGE